MSEIHKIDTMIWELEGACEVEHSVSQESIAALVASCGRAHTEIIRLRDVLEQISICTYKNYNLSDVTNIAEEALLQSPDVSKGQDDADV